MAIGGGAKATIEGGATARAAGGGVEGDRVWMTCSCGAVVVRVVEFG